MFALVSVLERTETGIAAPTNSLPLNSSFFSSKRFFLRILDWFYCTHIALKQLVTFSCAYFESWVLLIEFHMASM